MNRQFCKREDGGCSTFSRSNNKVPSRASKVKNNNDEKTDIREVASLSTLKFNTLTKKKDSQKRVVIISKRDV